MGGRLDDLTDFIRQEVKQKVYDRRRFGAAGAPVTVTTVFGRSGAVTAQTGDYTVAEVTGAAPLASPAFTGTPTGVTNSTATDASTQLATDAFVQAAIDAAVAAVVSVFGRTGVVVATSGDYTVSQVTGAAPLASPTFTGTPAAPTAAVSTNTTQLATTAFVVGQVATANPIIDGTATPGTSLLYARQDHVHPTDTSRAPTASPTFTGTGTYSGITINTAGYISNAYGSATAGVGFGITRASINLTAQTAAITATTLYAVPSANGVGQYRISWSAVVTTAATTSSTLGGAGSFQITYTDNDTNATVTTVANPEATATGNTVGTQISDVIVIYAKANTNIQYAFGYTSLGGTPMAYALHIKAEYLA